MRARVKLPKIFENKNKNQIKNIIENNIYNKEMKNIMISYYVYENCMIDIAIDYNVSRFTISKIISDGIKELER